MLVLATKKLHYIKHLEGHRKNVSEISGILMNKFYFLGKIIGMNYSQEIAFIYKTSWFPIWNQFESTWDSQRLNLPLDLVSVFCTGKLRGGQDRAPQFQCGLANYEAHYDLSWFRPHIGGNSTTSSGLILKMNRCYKGVCRELYKFTWWKRKMDLVPLPEG
jgi:hypothetical protein